MIIAITKTYYTKSVKGRKAGLKWPSGIFFTTADGKYWRTMEMEPVSLREVYEFKKKIKHELESRPKPVSLFE
jgi:hypothetical protein